MGLFSCRKEESFTARLNAASDHEPIPGEKADGATGGRGDGAKKQDQLRRPLAPSPHPPLASLGRVPGPVAESAPSLPAGTVTFLFTAIEGSTPLWEHHPATPAS
jgi:class 3 adenylate cyclase